MPDKAHAANPAMSPLFQAGRQWREVADARRETSTAMKFTRHCLVLLVSTLAGCASREEPFPSEMRAAIRQAPVLAIEEKIRDMVHASRDWEEAQFRNYRQRDIDGDGIDDTVLLTTFEHGNNWRRELFVCLSSAPRRVMHTNLGGKGERMADHVEITNRTIIITGKRYVAGDAMCCPSQAYESVFVITNGKIVEKP